MPFALGLFVVSLKYLRTPSTSLVWAMLALAVLNIAAKPSFMLCWLVVFPIALLLNNRERAATVRATLVCAAGGALLAAQYLYIYVVGRGDSEAESSGVRIDPFHVWSSYSDNIPLALVASYFFPLVALVLGGPAIWGSLAVRFAFGLAAVGLAWYAMVTETGPREFHGNFGWQAIVTNYVLFVAVLGAALPWLRRSRCGLRRIAVSTAFAMHVVAGVAWLHTYLNDGSYLTGGS
jgi:hypothetical protein